MRSEENIAGDVANDESVPVVLAADEVESYSLGFVSQLDVVSPTMSSLLSAGQRQDHDTALTDADISALHQVALPVLLQRSLVAPLLAQIAVVNDATVAYFLVQLKLRRHLSVLRAHLLLEDGEFARGLSEQLFARLTHARRAQDLSETGFLRATLDSALHAHSEDAAAAAAAPQDPEVAARMSLVARTPPNASCLVHGERSPYDWLVLLVAFQWKRFENVTSLFDATL